ncbi:MAG: hypothetical protein V4532_17105 [Pseudomonadota bacterium]
MSQVFSRGIARVASLITPFMVAASLVGCGGGTGSKNDSGPGKTYLRVEASDDAGDTLSYQWRTNAGTIENRNNKETVWTMPDGPGLHFAYVTVSDGKGGYVEQQYAVATDSLDVPAPSRVAVNNTLPVVTSGDEFAGGTVRLRIYAADTLPGGTGKLTQRHVYLPDIQVQVLKSGTSEQVFAGATDLGGEITLPKLAASQAYDIRCTTPQGVLLSGCTLSSSTQAQAINAAVTPPIARNLWLYGHVSLADGTICGMQSEFFSMQSSATVQLQEANGTVLTAPIKVNKFGDYALDAAVVVDASLKLKVQCEGHSATLDVPAAAPAYVLAAPVEMPAYTVPNSRPRLVKMVASGPDGNVRGKMVQPEAGDFSNTLPGPDHFLTYKGRDTKLSACKYYRSFGAVQDCDAQGNMVSPITLDDWKRQHQFTPYRGTNTEVAATYINQRDLNLVRRMVATQSASNDVAFVVCNHPGPVGQTQTEADQTIDTAMADKKMVACVAMEHSVTTGRNGGQPFTKFLTFAPDGSLRASVNLDGRGEKYMPGACVACHGGVQYSGRFQDRGNPSPDLKATFLPFDTGNYVFSTQSNLTEAAQSASLRQLNDLVLATSPSASTTSLIQGWYAGSSTTLNKAYVPPAWATFDPSTRGIVATTADASRFYREVVGTSCRTCHTAMRDSLDWDAGNGTFPHLMTYRNAAHICGGGSDVHVNASMPNALIARDRLQDRIRADSTLASLVQKFLGCTEPAADPLYPKR